MKWKAKLLLAVAVYAFVWFPPMIAVAQDLMPMEITEDPMLLRDDTPGPGGGLQLVAAPQEAEASETLSIQALIDKGTEAYEQLEFQKAMDYLSQALGREGATAEQRVTIHKYKGFVLIGQNDLQGARSEFLEALKIDPTLRLDPRLQSPKIMDVFEESRKEYQVYLVRTDREAPVIQFAPLEGEQPFGKSLEMKANVRDNQYMSVAQIYYRNAGEPFYSFLPLVDQGGGSYLGIVPAQSIMGKEVEYYLMGQDGAGNTSFEGTPREPYRVAVAPDPALKPWYKKWWVYGIGAMVVGGVAAGVALSQQDDEGAQPTTGTAVIDLNP